MQQNNSLAGGYSRFTSPVRIAVEMHCQPANPPTRQRIMPPETAVIFEHLRNLISHSEWSPMWSGDAVGE